MIVPRIFQNSQDLPREIVFSRLNALDNSVIVDFTQYADEDNNPLSAAVVISILSTSAIEDALSTPATASETNSLTRKRAAKIGGLSISQLGSATPEVIETYITNEILPTGTTEINAIAAVDAISTANVAAAVASIKPILKAIIRSQYRIMELLILIGKILAFIRDQIW